MFATFEFAARLARTLAPALAASLFAFSLHAQAPAASTRLEYRWLSEGVGGPSHVYFDATGRDYAVSDSVILTLDGVDRADVTTSGGGRDGWDVIVRFTPSATAAVADATAGHIGYRLAVLLDGRLVQVVTIGGRLGRVGGVITGVPRDSAEAVAARINAALPTSSDPRP